jgi:hypothetical protein
MADQESRQVRRQRARQESRKQTFERIHGQVLAGRTVRDLWLLYGGERMTRADMDRPEVRATVEHAFYAGCAAMLELLTRVAPEDVSEDVGVEMLTRLHDELTSYGKRGTQ